jgi:hypothetical protein
MQMEKNYKDLENWGDIKVGESESKFEPFFWLHFIVNSELFFWFK